MRFTFLVSWDFVVPDFFTKALQIKRIKSFFKIFFIKNKKSDKRTKNLKMISSDFI